METTVKEKKQSSAAPRLSRKGKRRLHIAAILLGAAAAALLIVFVILPSATYGKAKKLLAAGEPEGAMEQLAQIYNFRDAAALYGSACTQLGDGLLEKGKPIEAAIWFTRGGRSLEAEQIFDFHSVVTGSSYITAAIGKNGKSYYLSNREGDDKREGARTVAACSRFLPHSPGVNGLDQFGFVRLHAPGGYGVSLPDRQAERLTTLSGVKDVLCPAGGDYTVVLFNSGSVSVLSGEKQPLTGITGWSNIVSVKEGFRKIFGIDRAGRLHIAYENGYPEAQRYDVTGWSGLQKVEETGKAIVGLKRDGTVIVAYAGTQARYPGSMTYQQGITDIATNSSLLLLLRSNGSVKAVRVPNWASGPDSGADKYLDRIVSAVNGWRGVTRIRFAAKGVYGIRFNGAVNYISCDVSYDSGKRKYVYNTHADFAAAAARWTDAVDVISCGTHAVVVMADGTLRALGSGTYLESRPGNSGATDYLRKTDGEYLNVEGWKLW